MASSLPQDNPNFLTKQLINELGKLNRHLEAESQPTALGRIDAAKKVLQPNPQTPPSMPTFSNASMPDNLTIPGTNPGTFRSSAKGVQVPANIAQQQVEEQIAGQPSRTASAPVPKWAEGLNRTDIEDQKFKLPQFGQLTIQDKLEMARDLAGKRAYARMDDGLNPGVYGAIAQYSQRGINNAAQIYVAQQELRRISNFGQSGVAEGAALGYSPQGAAGPDNITIPGTNIGFRNPLSLIPGLGSDAAQEGWNQKLTSFRLAAQPGINREQASGIVNAINQYGYGSSTKMGNDMAYDMMAPLVAQGQDPNDIMALADQALRLGNTPLKDFTDTMKDLGEVAKDANMTIKGLSQGMAAYAEAASNAGATYAEGLRGSREFTQSTGLNPAQGVQFLQNPIVQGLAMQQGVLPSQIGLLGGGQISGLAQSSIDIAMQMAAPVADDLTQRLPDGTITQSGQERQMAQAAAQLGISREVVERYVKHPEQIKAAGLLTTELNEQSSTLKQARSRNTYKLDPVDPTKRQEGDSWTKLHPGKDDGPTLTKNAYGSSTDRDDKDKIGKTITDPFSYAQDDLLRRSVDPNDNIFSKQEILNRLKTTGISQSKIDQLADIKDLSKFNAEAKKAVGELNKTNVTSDDPNKVYVGFTGKAARFFQQTDKNGKKVDANAGKSSLSTAATDPASMTPSDAAGALSRGAYGG